MLIDTSGFFCLLSEEDFRHKLALEHFGSARQKHTHSFVLCELVSLAEARRFHRKLALDYVSNILYDLEIEIVWVDSLLTERANRLLLERLDKDWSLCDAASFLIMEDLGITDALTTDHHFEQAGFIKLLES